MHGIDGERLERHPADARFHRFPSPRQSIHARLAEWGFQPALGISPASSRSLDDDAGRPGDFFPAPLAGNAADTYEPTAAPIRAIRMSLMRALAEASLLRVPLAPPGKEGSASVRVTRRSGNARLRPD